jgi:hypothetical protein
VSIKSSALSERHRQALAAVHTSGAARVLDYGAPVPDAVLRIGRRVAALPGVSACSVTLRQAVATIRGRTPQADISRDNSETRRDRRWNT